MRKLTDRIRTIRKQLFEEITVVEYILWWALRIALLYAVIFHPDPSERVMCCINMLACYAMTALRLIAPRRSFVSRLNFRVQHVINFFEFLGTFLGNYLDAYSYVPKYDRILHALSGVGVVIAGYYVYKAMLPKGEKPYASVGAFCGVGFSFVVIVCWEISEFIGDFLFGTRNQCYQYSPGSNDIWFKIFGNGALGGEGQFPLWDTMLDMIDAAVATLIAGIAMFIVLKIADRHVSKKKEISNTPLCTSSDK